MQTVYGLLGIANMAIAFGYYGSNPMWITGINVGAAFYVFALIASINHKG